jgi:O-acetyl-ADP-ribose deacetylase (regulator of RNase III)
MAGQIQSNAGISSGGYWTNKSVLAFAGAAQPISAMRDRVRALVLEAIQEGWGGPPFDPFKLAELLKIEVVPSQEVLEARTSSLGTKFRIEYNPNRGINRARYSVAHEIAHTLFPDCADAIRNRIPYHGGEGDSWQLEMLCNIGAAEILMPVGSGLECPTDPEDFTRLLDLRERFKVSTEALLLRMARLCGLSVFAASVDQRHSQPVINYVISNFANIRIKEGTALSSHSVVTQCTAIGFTAQGTEKWPIVGPVQIQCVGVPPYPGHVKPRVLGILRSPESTPASLPKTQYLRGDATQPRGSGLKILAQIVNDKALTWGGGLSLAVRRKWPNVQKEFTDWFENVAGSPSLGKVHFSQPVGDIVVASIVAQSGYGVSPRPRIRYGALERGLSELGRKAQAISASVHMPRIGCGEAGGSWNIVGELVEANLAARGISVTVYDHPGKGAIERQASIPGLFDK